MSEEDDEIECVDCGADIIVEAEDPLIRVAQDKIEARERIRNNLRANLSPSSKRKEPRCDTCKDHHYKLCDEDCPVICDACKKHHFGDCTP